jgi:hypothetical protein
LTEWTSRGWAPIPNHPDGTLYFDYSRCAPDEMSAIVHRTRWSLVRVLQERADEPYVAIIEKA